jgi:hypothetical protein
VACHSLYGLLKEKDMSNGNEDAEITRDMQRHLDKNKGHDVDSGRWKTNKDKWQPHNHNKNTQAGKGDSTRQSTISDEEYALKWDLAFGNISKKDFEKELKKLKENL